MKNLSIQLLLVFVYLDANSHGGVDHSKPRIDHFKSNKVKVEKINKMYVKNIKSIFETKCLDCHSKNRKLPWYHKVPGVQQMIDNDISEGLKHLDMTKDFPFEGHGNMAEDLRSIQSAVENNNMPPRNYRMIHWNATLNPEEKEAIQNWISQALKELGPSK